MKTVSIFSSTPPKWNAELYHKNSRLQEQYAHDVLNREVFVGNENVLDVGCGDGKISAYIAHEKVPEGSVYAIDASSEMIAFAHGRYFQTSTNLTYSVVDVRSIPFQERFDKVFSFWCLHWIEEQVTALENIRKSLKKNGTATLMISALTPFHQEMIESIKRVAQDKRWKRYVEGLTYPLSWVQTADEYREKIHTAGFKAAEVIEVKKVFRCPSVKDFLDARKATIPHVRLLPDALSDEFVQETFDFFLRKAPVHQDGSIDQEVVFLVVKAVKS